MKHMIFPEQQRPGNIEWGDAGVIFTKDGGFYVFSSGDIDPDNLTDVQADQAVAINALKIALKAPGIMAMLVKMASDPRVISGVELLERQERATAN